MKAVVSFSGGLDSTTCLAWAINRGYKTVAISFDYGQRHIKEIESAKKIADYYRVKLIEVKFSLPWLDKSSLVNKNKELPNIPIKNITSGRIPTTYVPARNLVFASMLVSYAEAESIDYIIMGPNAVDFSGYPDCRPKFYDYLNLALKHGTKKGNIKILTPLINLSKKKIIQLAVKLNAPLKYTWSCYRGDVKPCGKCDACKLRAKGFKEAGIEDPALI